MKILSIGNFWRGWDNSICDEEHIARALEELGHMVYRQQREEPWAYEDKGPFDFTLIAQWDRYTDEQLTRLPHPLVYWAFDLQREGQAWHERLIEAADLYLSKMFSDHVRPNWRWLAQDFAPPLLDRVFGVEQDIDVLFTGTRLPYSGLRNEIVEAVDQPFNLHVYSMTEADWRNAGIKHVHAPEVDTALAPLTARAKITLSVDWAQEPGYWSDRNAQVMACGGFVLANWVPFAEVRFPRGLVWYYSVGDCLEKIDYYLRHEQERQAIADEGYHYAHEYLMARNRAQDLLTIVRSVL